MMVLNNGMATITVWSRYYQGWRSNPTQFTDALAENGNMFLISNVLVPIDVRLPAQH
jgi:hypothetical protein